MFVKCKKYENGKGVKRAYTYETNDTYAVGDLVQAEFGDAITTLIVTEVDVEEPNFQCKPILGVAEEVVGLPSTERPLETIYGSLTVSKVADLTKMDFDEEEVSKAILAELPDAKNIVVTEDNYKVVKQTTIKRFKEASKELDEIRKTPKRIFNQAVAEYDDKMKKLISLVEEGAYTCQEKVESFEEAVRQAHRKVAEEAIKELSEGIEERFRAFEMKDKYSQLSVSDKAIKDDVKDQANALRQKQETFHLQKEAVKFAVERENENLINKIDPEEYDEALFRNVMEMGDLSSVLETIKAHADRERAKEKRVEEEKSKEIKVRAEAKLREEIEVQAEAKLREEIEREKAKEVVKPAPKGEMKEYTYLVKCTEEQHAWFTTIAQENGIQISVVPF